MDSAVLDRPQLKVPPTEGEKPRELAKTREAAVGAFNQGFDVLNKVSAKIWDRLQVSGSDPSQEEERILNGKLAIDNARARVMQINGRMDEGNLTPDMNFILTLKMGERDVPYGIPINTMIEAIAYQVAVMDTAKEFVTEGVTRKIDEEVAALNELGMKIMDNSIQLNDLVRGRLDQRGIGDNEGVRIFYPRDGDQLKQDNEFIKENGQSDHLATEPLNVVAQPESSNIPSPGPSTESSRDTIVNTFPAVTGISPAMNETIPTRTTTSDTVVTPIRSSTSSRMDAVRSSLRSVNGAFSSSATTVTNPGKGDGGAGIRVNTPTVSTSVDNPGTSFPERPEVTDPSERRRLGLLPLVGAGILATALLTRDSNPVNNAAIGQALQDVPQGIVQGGTMPSQNPDLTGLRVTQELDNAPVFGTTDVGSTDLSKPGFGRRPSVSEGELDEKPTGIPSTVPDSVPNTAPPTEPAPVVTGTIT